MQTEGKLYKCDRCGIETFVERKENLVIDGEFTRERIYEYAIGWTRENDGREWRDLCPACSNQFRKVVDQFWRNKLDMPARTNKGE